MPSDLDAKVIEAYDSSRSALAAVRAARKNSPTNEGMLQSAEVALKQAIARLTTALQGSLPLRSPPADDAKPKRKARKSVDQVRRAKRGS